MRRLRPHLTMAANALDHITIEGFKSIKSIERLPLRPVNLVIGANGSGKSNFIGFFAFLQAIREGRLKNYVAAAGGAEKLLHFGSKTTKTIATHLSFRDGVNQYSLRLEPSAEDLLFPADEHVYYWDKSKGDKNPYDQLLPSQEGEAGIGGAHSMGISGWVRYQLTQWRLYHVHDTSFSSPMRKTAATNDNRFLRPDGSNLAAFLYMLREGYPHEYRLIQGAVRRVAPFFDDFHLEPLRLNPDSIRLEWRHQNSDQYFDAAALSDGTLRFIALATLFLQPPPLRSSVILVDEPELGLHPYAITLLASLIQQAAVDSQVIVSTQSSLLLDHFEPEDVLVAERKDDATQLTRLETPQLSQWLERYSLGQLWEKNHIGGRPRG
jgi:predicted ATPase